MRELKLDEARLEMLPEVMTLIDGILEQLECPMKTQMQLDVAVEEIYANIAHYAYADGAGPVVIRAEVEPERVLAITFIDEGMPFDPLARPDPDTTLPLEARKIGGLGIYMVKNSLDDVTYLREDGGNVLTLRKRI